jgi:hypothetical protein
MMIFVCHFYIVRCRLLIFVYCWLALRTIPMTADWLLPGYTSGTNGRKSIDIVIDEFKWHQIQSFRLTLWDISSFHHCAILADVWKDQTKYRSYIYILIRRNPHWYSSLSPPKTAHARSWKRQTNGPHFTLKWMDKEVTLEKQELNALKVT